MSRTSTVVWSLIGGVFAILGTLALVYGPGLYRESQALVGPIMEMARSEDRIAALNQELPFSRAADGTVAEDRFMVFLAVRRDLLPRYREWQDMERRLERQGEEDWETAKEVLSAIRGVINLQIETLRDHGMSPAEFVWIEDLVYLTWRDGIAPNLESSAVTDRLRQTTSADLEVLAELERAHGSSRATRRFAEHLKRRLEGLDTPELPAIDGVSDASSKLFWTHRDEIGELDLAAYSELHSIIRGTESVEIKVGEG
jgi:hypothetical protein